MIKRLLDRAALAFLSNLPIPLMRHLMFLLRSHPEVADRWGYHIRPAHYYEPLPDFSGGRPMANGRRFRTIQSGDELLDDARINRTVRPAVACHVI